MAKREVKCNSYYAIVHNLSNMCDTVTYANSFGPIVKSSGPPLKVRKIAHPLADIPEVIILT